MLRKVVAGILLVSFGALLLACGAMGTQEALDFNQKIVAANQRLEAAGKKLGDHAHGAGAGNQAELAALKKAYEELKQTLVSVRTEVQGLKVPSKQSAKDFHAAELKYLDAMEKVIADFGEMIRVLEDRTLNPADKITKLEVIQKRLDAAEKANVGQLETAQAAFARDYNIKLMK
jgi:hypothetical protein